MKKTFFSLLLLVGVSHLNAQQRTPDGRVNFVASNDRFQFVNPFDERQVNTRGTRFFLDSFYRPGELKTAKQLYTTELLYRFDQIERTLQVKLENGKEMFLRETDVEYFKIFFGERSIHFVNAPVPNGQKTTLVQVIYQSPTLQLLRDARKYTYRVKSDNLDGYSSEEIYDDIRKDYRYFLRRGADRPFIEVKPTEKSLIKAMPNKKRQLTQLFKAAKGKGGLTVTKIADILREIDKPIEEKVSN